MASQTPHSWTPEKTRVLTLRDSGNSQPELVSHTVTRTISQRGGSPKFDQNRELIAVAAYYLAEQRGFAPGHEAEDWARAEGMIRADFGSP